MPEYPTSNDAPAISLKKIIVNTAEILNAGYPGGDATFTKVTTPTVAAATSAGLVLEAANGTDAILVGPGNTANVTFLGNATVPAGYTMTSAGSISFTAGGTNQNITLTPSGTGAVTAVNSGGVALVAQRNNSTVAGIQSVVLIRNDDTTAGNTVVLGFATLNASLATTGSASIVAVNVGRGATTVTADLAFRVNNNDTSPAERFRLFANGSANVAVGVATPAGGSTAARLLFGSTAGFGIYIGSGAPTVSAAQGSLYLRSDGSSTSSRAYINTNGSTGWTAITTAA